MEKKDCYIFWDEDDNIKENERKVYIQCQDCFNKNNKGMKWPGRLLYGKNEIKCSFCHTIIYKKAKRRRLDIPKSS